MTRSEPGREAEAGPVTAPAADTTRLTVSWLIVGVPLAYGFIETIRAVLPLFGG